MSCSCILLKCFLFIPLNGHEWRQTQEAFVKNRTRPDAGPDQMKYTGEHKLLSAREVTIATCVQAIQIQQAATSMEQAVEIQQSATVTSMEQVIEIASDDSDFESDTSTEGGFVSDSEGEEELQEAIRRSLRSLIVGSSHGPPRSA